MRGRRRTQKEHTNWSCLICELQLLSPFIDTSSQGEHLQAATIHNSVCRLTLTRQP
ncbi:hypothetical protein PVAP13_6KG180235 [Panicum virgatum]|uniref:Uncharacterized protein n=1 Tax=Panicum virgatum TaxID=38727 RepID=A0A8T0R9R3_PANVG|nr:hypothetical protein PVAP13_6KG180235 [Panicum virgatum]